MNENFKHQTALIYVRLSSKKQEDGMSKEVQEEKCRAFCEKEEMSVKAVYYENKSALHGSKRPVFEEILALQKTKDRVDVIMVYTLNRLTRNHPDFYFIRELVDKYNTKIVFVKENMVIQKPFKSYEKYFFNILVANAEFEIEHMKEIRKIGLLARAKTGKRPCLAPYGYKTYKNKIVVVPNDANFVKKAYELYATGSYSINSLCDELYEQGFYYSKQPNKKIPRASLSSMLKNLFYTGYYTFPDCEGEIKGTHKPIIERELYDKVQKMLSISGYEKIKKHQFLYSQLLTLQETGKLMTGEIKKGQYIYYKAYDNEKKYHCINETLVTEAILEYFKEIRLNLIPKEIVKSVLKEELKDLKQEYSTLKRNVSRKYHRKLLLNDFIKKDKIDDTDFIFDELEDIENTYENLNERIKESEEQIRQITSKCEDIMKKRLYDIYIQLNFENQRKILELVKSKLELQDKKVKLTFKSAFRKIRQR